MGVRKEKEKFRTWSQLNSICGPTKLRRIGVKDVELFKVHCSLNGVEHLHYKRFFLMFNIRSRVWD